MTDKQHQTKGTGHNWDGITELDNPPPRWWLNALYLSGLLVLVYFILYPALPLVKGSSEGLLGWTQMTEYKEQMAEVEAIRAPYEQQISASSVDMILSDNALLQYVMTSSKVLFGDNCAACHGVGGQPQSGMAYPVLADDDWLYGGTTDDIMLSIAQGRVGYMPAHADELTEGELALLTDFVIHGADEQYSPAGKALFIKKECVSCHGDDAKGDKSAGSANLTDKVWRFSKHEQAVRETILHGVNDDSDPNTRQAVMPSWNQRLAAKIRAKQEALEAGETLTELDLQQVFTGDETERLSENDIKKLTIYVHQMGGGE